ncbi:MAG: biotin--protein ligase [Betaproteobacteria bacterium]|jgi:lipoate-protein ligase A|nr:biotin--protein ligase [Betaproteobacteria bacterium]
MAGRAARWIRLGVVEPLELHASYAGLAAAQATDSAPIVLWAQAKAHLCLGQSQGLGEVERASAVPVVRRPLGGGLVWVDENQYVFVLIAPRRDAPGRPARWFSWALAPVIATYRQFGLQAYLNGNDIWLQGRKIAGAGAASIGECAVVASSFLLRFPLERFADSVASPSPEFRAWLREGLALAMTEWAAHGALPAERVLEDCFRGRLEAQYGWRFENAWPSEAELAAIGEARAELSEPIDDDLPRSVAGGVRLNATSTLVERRHGDRIERVLTIDGDLRRESED